MLGVVHPEVLERFDWKYPVTLLEMNIQEIVNDFWKYNKTNLSKSLIFINISHRLIKTPIHWFVNSNRF